MNYELLRRDSLRQKMIRYKLIDHMTLVRILIIIKQIRVMKNIMLLQILGQRCRVGNIVCGKNLVIFGKYRKSNFFSLWHNTRLYRRIGWRIGYRHIRIILRLFQDLIPSGLLKQPGKHGYILLLFHQFGQYHSRYLLFYILGHSGNTGSPQKGPYSYHCIYSSHNPQFYSLTIA